MAYREDENLEFLGQCTDSELDILVQTLTTGKGGVTRYTEALTSKDAYKAFYPKHSMYWDAIAEEVQTYGANTLASMFRGGKGVLYRKVLLDVCKKMKVNFPDHASVEVLERNLLIRVFEDAVEHMKPEEIRQLVEELNLKTTKCTGQAVMAAIQVAIKANGVLFYKIALIVANGVAKALLGRGLTFVGNQMLLRSVSAFAGPIGWAITGIWALTDIAGPAYRVTIPAVIQVACLRAKQQNDSTEAPIESEVPQSGETEESSKLGHAFGVLGGSVPNKQK